MSDPQQTPKTSDSSTNWSFISTKLTFFTRMRRFLRRNAAKKPPQHADQKQMDIDTNMFKEEKVEEGIMVKSEAVEVDDDHNFGDLRTCVKMLHFGRCEERETAAREIKKLAEEDEKLRKKMAELGVIPPLVAMVGSETTSRRRLAVLALVELANGSFKNKALIVEAGILSKLPENIGVDLDETTKHEFAQLLLSISTLSNTQFPLTSARIIPVTVSILESCSRIETKESCLTALQNLSSVLDNVGPLISTGVISTLTALSSAKETSEKSLATLGNLVVTLAGRKALEDDPTVPEGLIEIMTWDDSPKCQELSAYVLMILAHNSPLQRQKMAKAGIVQVLLEIALLGSPLAQKRALKILQWFNDERQGRMGPHSGPQMRRMSFSSPINRREVDEGKRLMKKIVKQSLHKNMETITRRANGGDDSSRLKALVISSSSKSLPY